MEAGWAPPHVGESKEGAHHKTAHGPRPFLLRHGPREGQKGGLALVGRRNVARSRRSGPTHVHTTPLPGARAAFAA